MKFAEPRLRAAPSSGLPDGLNLPVNAEFTEVTEIHIWSYPLVLFEARIATYRDLITVLLDFAEQVLL